MSQISPFNLIFITQSLDRICKSQKIIVILIATWLATLAVVLVGYNNVHPHPAQIPSSVTERPTKTLSINGSILLDTRCSVCHSTDKPRQAEKTREEWKQTVNRMIGKGAKLTDKEKAVLLDYLAKIYGDENTRKSNK